MEEPKNVLLTLEAVYQRTQLFKEHAKVQAILSRIDTKNSTPYTDEFQMIMDYMLIMVNVLKLCDDTVIDLLDEIQKDIARNIKMFSSLRTKASFDNCITVMKTIRDALYDLK